MLQNIMDRLHLAKHFFSSVRRRGVSRTLRIVLYEVWFERKFGAGTGVIIPVGRLDYDEESRSHAEQYFPSSYLFLHEALAVGPVDFSGRVFVDFGCGMGRVLLFASTLQFKRLIGVELSPSLSEVARQNLERYYLAQSKLTPDWIIINDDAGRYYPPDDATVFYMFNSFDETIVARVLDNIKTSLSATPRKCYLIYSNPVHEWLFVEKGFERIAQPIRDYVIFTNCD